MNSDIWDVSMGKLFGRIVEKSFIFTINNEGD